MSNTIGQIIRLSKDTDTSAPLRTRMRPQPPAGLDLMPGAQDIEGRKYFTWKGKGRLWGVCTPVFNSHIFLFVSKVWVELPVQTPEGWFWVYKVETAT